MTISRKNIADSKDTGPAKNGSSEEKADGGGDDDSSFLDEVQEEIDSLLCKLRYLEILCHVSEDPESAPIIEDIIGILKKTDNEFVPPNPTTPENED